MTITQEKKMVEMDKWSHSYIVTFEVSSKIKGNNIFALVYTVFVLIIRK